MTDERYDHASALAAHMVNVLARDEPGGKAVTFGKLLFLLLAAMKEAECRACARLLEPGHN